MASTAIIYFLICCWGLDIPDQGAGKVSSIESSLPGLQMAAFSPCPHMIFPLYERERERSGVSSSSLKAINTNRLGPNLMTSFKPNHYPKGHISKFQVRASPHEFGRGERTWFSPQHSGRTMLSTCWLEKTFFLSHPLPWIIVWTSGSGTFGQTLLKTWLFKVLEINQGEEKLRFKEVGYYSNTHNSTKLSWN